MSNNPHHPIPLGYQPVDIERQSRAGAWKRRWCLFAIGVMVGAVISTPHWLGTRGMTLFWIVWAVLGVECALGAYFLETPSRKALGLGIWASIPIVVIAVMFVEAFTRLR